MLYFPVEFRVAFMEDLIGCALDSQIQSIWRKNESNIEIHPGLPKWFKYLKHLCLQSFFKSWVLQRMRYRVEKQGSYRQPRKKYVKKAFKLMTSVGWEGGGGIATLPVLMHIAYLTRVNVIYLLNAITKSIWLLPQKLRGQTWSKTCPLIICPLIRAYDSIL